MLILAIDTASVFCAAGLVDNNRPLARASENIGKGHAEYLMGQITTVMGDARKDFADIDRISVNIGPGSFTGVRVGISAARGLALALDRPVIGISTFEALAFEATQHYKNQPVTVVLEAHRGTLYVQNFDAGNHATHAPRIDTAQAIAATLPETAVLSGSGADKIAQLVLRPLADTKPTADIETYALLAAKKKPSEKPSPLYMRSPDAKPQAGFILPRA